MPTDSSSDSSNSIPPTNNETTEATGTSGSIGDLLDAALPKDESTVAPITNIPGSDQALEQAEAQATASEIKPVETSQTEEPTVVDIEQSDEQDDSSDEDPKILPVDD